MPFGVVVTVVELIKLSQAVGYMFHCIKVNNYNTLTCTILCFILVLAKPKLFLSGQNIIAEPKKRFGFAKTKTKHKIMQVRQYAMCTK